MFRATSRRDRTVSTDPAKPGEAVPENDIQYRARVGLAAASVTAWEAQPRAGAPRQRGASYVNGAGKLLAQACLQAQSWREAGHGSAHEWLVAVDVSRRQLVSGVALEQVDRALAVSRLPPACLQLILSDIGPGALDLPLLRTIWALRDRGIALMLRDVGYDGSGLAVLRRVPATAIAFPPRAIRAASESAEEAAYLRALVTAAQTLELATVASGVATEAHRQAAATLGCSDAEGELFAALAPGRPPETQAAAAEMNDGEDTCAAPATTPELLHECHSVSY